MTKVYYDKPINNNDYLIEVHIADIHFGSINPHEQFIILKEQFLDKIATFNFDILSIDGDIFDKKFMANHDAILYGLEFVRICTEICKAKQATIIIIHGTESHDSGQLKLFYGYLDDPYLDIRIVEQTKFEYVKGLKILCIPEEYGKGEEYYRQYLDELYDTVFMHGTIEGAVYGANKEDLNSSKYPVFSLNSFNGCLGPIIAGHVHKAMCLNGYMYYCSNPIRYRFGEEEEKGFCIVVHNRVTNSHTFDFIPIESFRYSTIDIKDLEYNDPDKVIAYLNGLLSNGIHNIRIDFSEDIPTAQKIIEEYYMNNPHISIKRYVSKNDPKVNTTEEIQNKYSDLDFLLDSKLDSYTKFVHFINHNMGTQFITVEKLKTVLEGCV